jgi:hypothetical protein
MRDDTLASGSTSTMVTLAAWGSIFAGIAAITAHYADHSQDPGWTPESAITRTRELAGAGASACGMVPEGGDARSAYACAAHAQRHEPYWMTRARRGEGGVLLVVGLAARARGKTYLVVYDDDRSGAGGRDRDRRRPYLGVEECRDIRFSATPGMFGMQHSCR